MTQTARTPGFGEAWSAGLRRGSEAELRGWLELALAMCDEADGMALAGFRRDLQISAKPDRSLVTQVDQAIERHLRERILAAHPDHGLIGEEEGETRPEAAVRWYLDPIDGTHNFIRGVPLFGTLLGISRDGEMQVGVVSAPALRQRWYAWRGGGAWVTGSPGAPAPGPRRIHVSAVGAAGGRPAGVQLADRHRAGGARLPVARAAGPGATAASATSGATRWWPKGRPRP